MTDFVAYNNARFAAGPLSTLGGAMLGGGQQLPGSVVGWTEPEILAALGGSPLYLLSETPSTPDVPPTPTPEPIATAAVVEDSIVMEPNRAAPNIPPVSEDITSHIRAINALREAVEIGERRTRDIPNSFVRVDELVRLGVLMLDGSRASLNLTAAVTGGGSGSGFGIDGGGPSSIYGAGSIDGGTP